MNDYTELENDILARLAPLEDEGIEVEAMPETDEDYSEPFAKPRVSVSYQHSEFDDQPTRGLPSIMTTNEMAQDEYAEVHIVIRSRLIRGGNGTHTVQRKVAELLYGYMPTNWGRMFVKSYDYLGHRNGTWVYDMVMTTRRMVVQQFTDDHETVYPTVQQVDVYNFYEGDVG